MSAIKCVPKSKIRERFQPNMENTWTDKLFTGLREKGNNTTLVL